jgi:hypothetical protein
MIGWWGSAPLGDMCYERTCDQGTIGSVAALRHSRTPGRTMGFLVSGRSLVGPSSPRSNQRIHGTRVT